MGCGGDGAARHDGEEVFVDADVKAGLLKLFFDVDLALADERLEVGAEPGDLGSGESAFGDVDGLAGEVRRGGVAGGGCGVAVGADQALLDGESADGGVDLERGVEGGVVVAGQDGEEFRGPGSGEAAILGQVEVDVDGFVFGQGYELLCAAEVEQFGVVADAVAAVAVGHLILVEQDFVGAVERLGDDEVAAAVVEGRDPEGRQEDGRGGFLLNGLERECSGDRGAEDAVHVGEGGGGGVGSGCGLFGGRRRWRGAGGGARAGLLARSTVGGGDGRLGGEGALAIEGAGKGMIQAAGAGRSADGNRLARGSRGEALRAGRSSAGGVGAGGRPLAGDAGCGLGEDEPPRRGAGDGSRGLGVQRRGAAEQQTGQRTQDSRDGVSAHVKFLEVRRHQSNFYPIWYVDMG